jgi:hypothetical protein
MSHPKVSLQISLAPPDVRHAVHILSHQLRTLSAQMDEVILVLDARKSRTARFNTGWDDAAPTMASFLEEIAHGDNKLRIVYVDYGRESSRRIASEFFGRASIPAKDIRGGPFFAYFFGLAAAAHDYVFHLDSDMLLGGGSQTWVSEAVDLVERRPEVIAVCPLPGPPTADGLLRDQDAYAPQREGPFTFRFTHFTSRLFLCDRTRLTRSGAPIPLLREVAWPARVKGALTRQSMFALPERLITLMMREHRLIRVDQLGEPPGLWAVHPVERSAEFIDALPNIIARIEGGEVTEHQLGRYNLHPTMLSAAARC